MSSEIQVRKSAELAEAPSAESNILTVIARAAADPSVDVAKMAALLDMQERVMRIQADVAFKAALARIQPRMPRVNRLGKIEVSGVVRSKYAKYEDIDEAIRPLLAEEGFSVDFDTESSDRALTVKMRVSHAAGHSEHRRLTLPFDASGSKSGTQGVGSTLSYGKRYLLTAFFNIITVDEDQDGAEYIGLDDQNRVRDLLIATGSDELRFLAWLGASSVKTIPVNRLDAALAALRKKAKK